MVTKKLFEQKVKLVTNTHSYFQKKFYSNDFYGLSDVKTYTDRFNPDNNTVCFTVFINKHLKKLFNDGEAKSIALICAPSNKRSVYDDPHSQFEGSS